MKLHNIFKGMALVAGSALMLTACDDEKLLTTDFEEIFLPTDVQLHVSEMLPVGVGMDTTLAYTLLPLDYPDRDVAFLTSNEKVATVDADGTVHGVSVGEATITCTLPIGFGPNSTVIIQVIPEVIKAETLTLTNTTDLGEEGKIYVTDEIQLKGEIMPLNHTYDRLIWYSSDEKIATVDENGLVHCLAVGDVTISAVTTDRSGVKGSIDLHIEAYIAAESLTIEPVADPVCLIGGPVTLNVSYFPAGATLGSVEWTSSDETIATVHRGVVTPTGFGNVTIIGTCVETGEQAQVNIEIPAGWYVWNAANNFVGLSKATSWISSNEKPVIVNGAWHLVFPDAGTGKWRRDIKLDCSNNDLFQMHKSMPVLALRGTFPRGGVNTWDVRDSGNPRDNDGFDLPDGTRLIMIDLTAKFAGWDAYHGFNLFQLKVADIPNGNVDPSKPYYDIMWARTFATADEAKAFATKDAEENPFVD